MWKEGISPFLKPKYPLLSSAVTVVLLVLVIMVSLAVKEVNTRKVQEMILSSQGYLTRSLYEKIDETMAHIGRLTQLDPQSAEWEIASKYVRLEYPEIKEFFVFDSSFEFIRSYPNNQNDVWVQTLQKGISSNPTLEAMPVDRHHVAPVVSYKTKSGQSHYLAVVLDPQESFQLMTKTVTDDNILFAIWAPDGQLLHAHPLPLDSYDLSFPLVIRSIPFRLGMTFFPEVSHTLTVLYPIVIFIFGSILSVLLGHLIWQIQVRQLASQEKVQFLLDNSDRGMVMVDSKGVIKRQNKSAATWLHAKSGDQVTDKIKKQYSILEGYFPAISIVHHEGEMILQKRLKKGQVEQFLKLTSNSVGESEEEDRLIILEDITKTMLKSRFNYDVMTHFGHKFRTPLTSIFSSIQLLKDEALGKIDPKQSEVLAVIDNSLRTLKKDLQQQTLFYSAMQNPYYIKACDNFKSSTQSVLSDWEMKQHLGRKIDIKLVADAEDWTHPLLSYENLHTILTQLLDNSLKFATKSTLKITVTLKRTAKGIDLIYQDNGPGIPNVYLKKIFDPFFQIDIEKTGQTPGLGLGLPIIRELVVKSKGDVKMPTNKKGFFLQCHWSL